MIKYSVSDTGAKRTAEISTASVVFTVKSIDDSLQSFWEDNILACSSTENGFIIISCDRTESYRCAIHIILYSKGSYLL